MVIPYVIVVLCLVSPSTQFTGLGNTQVFDDAERASIIQTGESFPAQVSVVESPDIGDGGGGGFGGILMMGLPLLLLLALLGGGTALTTTPAPGSVAGSGCPVCSTTVQTTCPTTTTVQCSPTAACPTGFVAVVNGDANKCYLASSTTVTNFGAASAACATVGGQLFEPRSTGELDAVRTSLIAATSTASYFIGYSSINNIAQGPVGFYTGAGLPANSAATAPAFTPTAANCVTVQRTGGYQGGLCTTNAGSNVLCEARLDQANCVCP
ncbi:spore coat protein SP65-like [Mytilus edulis]|uniref:spore coat protein SP65-like n=1 Tax=Mytilus edulis TaxID=6550 RepID=UPI0039EE6497